MVISVDFLMTLSYFTVMLLSPKFACDIME